VISEDTTYNITVFKCVRYNELDIAAAEWKGLLTLLASCVSLAADL
jgi:hypothetical protein